MAELRVAHTGDLDPSELRDARALLYDVFDDMTEEDWEHCLGGVHAIAHADGRIVAHASVVMRRILHGGRALRAGYVEGVAVRAEHRRRGLGGLVMEPLERLIRRAYDLGALGATDEAAKFYASRGWQPWRGKTFALTPDGIVRTAEEDDGLFVFPAARPLELTGDLTCDWRDGAGW